jgi:hypothetical protein
MAGFKGEASYASIGSLIGFSGATGAVTAGQVLTEMSYPLHSGRIAGLSVQAVTAGTGAGSTVVDVLLNGVSIFGAAGDKPTLSAVATGVFAMSPPAVRALKYEDRISIIVLSVSTTGHARLSATLAFQKA